MTGTSARSVTWSGPDTKLWSPPDLARPGHEPAVVEAQREVHLHRDLAAHALDHADQIGVVRAQRHEVGHARQRRSGVSHSVSRTSVLST